MDSTFLNLGKGTRLTTFMNLKMDEGAVYRHATDYTHIEMGHRPVLDSDGKEVEKINRNQTVVFEAPCTVRPMRLYKVLVTVNPELAQYANVPLMFLIDYQGDNAKPQQVQVAAQFRRDFDPSKLSWLFHLSLLS